MVLAIALMSRLGPPGATHALQRRYHDRGDASVSRGSRTWPALIAALRAGRWAGQSKRPENDGGREPFYGRAKLTRRSLGVAKGYRAAKRSPDARTAENARPASF
jgi:hypothetical protein